MSENATSPRAVPHRRNVVHAAGMVGVVALGLLVGAEASAPAPIAFPPSAVPSLVDDAAPPPRSTTPAASSDAAALPDDARWFDGRPVVPVRRLAMRVTAYSPDERSCAPYADGITASGYSVWTNGMALVAADTDVLPFGTLITVPGYAGDAVVPVLDRGARIRGERLDVLYPTHEAARAWGVQELEVTVWQYADGEPSGFELGW
jgi:3D (Asp-Asp-Asp) domain-containing protein